MIYAKGHVRITEVDNLRGLAILLVAIYHFFPHFLPLGFLGVDVFFLVSGYLILSKTCRPQFGGRDIPKFYSNRIARILPLLTLVSVLFLPLSLLLGPSDSERFIRSISYSLVGLSNLLFFSEAGYFDISSLRKPFLHTWSLSVELQFYLIAPFLGLAYLRFKDSLKSPFLILLFCVFLAIGIYGFFRHPSGAFYFLPFRLWEFLLGGAVAILAGGFGPKIGGLAANGIFRYASHYLLVLILPLLFLKLSNDEASVVRYLLLSGCALFILARAQSLSAEKVESDLSRFKVVVSRLLRFLSKYSYGIYLFHYPIVITLLVFAYPRSPSVALSVVGVAASVVLAVASYHLIEKPWIVRTREDIRANSLLLVLSCCILAPSVSHFLGHSGSFLRSGLYEALFSQDVATRRWYINDEAQKTQLSLEKLKSTAGCYFKVENDSIDLSQYMVCLEKFKRPVVVLGDSHARDLVLALTENGQAKFIVDFTQAGCRIEPSAGPECHTDGGHLLGKLRAASELLVFYEESALYMFVDADGNPTNREIINSFNLSDQAIRDGLKINSDLLDYKARFLSDLAQEVTLIVSYPRYEPHHDIGDMMLRGCFSENLNSSLVTSYKAVAAELESRVLAFTVSGQGKAPLKLQVESELGLARDSLTCEGIYYRDGDHFTRSGALSFYRLVGTAIEGKRREL